MYIFSTNSLYINILCLKLNQASASLDLSQLYGCNRVEQRYIRQYKNGLLRTSHNGRNLVEHNDDEEGLLPLASVDSHKFCATTNASDGQASCFVAADSRVNSNPYSIAIYTLFMRNHNLLARLLKAKFTNWSDERLFTEAKYLNELIYGRIIYREWLPEVLGSTYTQSMIKNGKNNQENSKERNSLQILNEFGVAASRFYFSMIPNVLNTNDHEMKSFIFTKRFFLGEEIYSPSFNYTSKTLDDILQALMNEKALEVDAKYENSVCTNFLCNII